MNRSARSVAADVQAQAMQECARNQNCTLVITPGQTGVNVEVGRR